MVDRIIEIVIKVSETKAYEMIETNYIKLGRMLHDATMSALIEDAQTYTGNSIEIIEKLIEKLKGNITKENDSD